MQPQKPLPGLFIAPFPCLLSKGVRPHCCRRRCATFRMQSSYVIHEDDGDAEFMVQMGSEEKEKNKHRSDAPFIQNCSTCNNSGFVPCSKCDAQGVIRNQRSVNVFYCPDCVGHKKLRCHACGGKCYMCE